MPPRSRKNLHQPKIYQFSEVARSLDTVKVSDAVTGFESAYQLDDLVCALVRNASLKNRKISREVCAPWLDARGRHRYNNWPHTTELPSEAMRPKKVRGLPFTGTLRDMSATLLDRVIRRQEERRVVRVVEIMLNADMHSSGRGVVGKSLKLLQFRPSHEPPHIGCVSYEPIEGDTADLAAQFLLAESASAERLATIEGLRRVILAGLPELGKR